MNQATISAVQPAGVNYIDERRVASLEDRSAVPKYRTVKRKIDMASLSTEDIKQLDDLITAFGKQCASFTQRFARRTWRPYCEGSRYMELRDRLVAQHNQAAKKAKKAGKVPESPYPFGLQARPCRWPPTSSSGIGGGSSARRSPCFGAERCGRL